MVYLFCSVISTQSEVNKLWFLPFLQWELFEIGRDLGCGVYILPLGYDMVTLSLRQAAKVLSRKPAFVSLEFPKVKSRSLISRAYHGTQTITDSPLRHVIGAVDLVSSIHGWIDRIQEFTSLASIERDRAQIDLTSKEYAHRNFGPQEGVQCSHESSGYEISYLITLEKRGQRSQSSTFYSATSAAQVLHMACI